MKNKVISVSAEMRNGELEIHFLRFDKSRQGPEYAYSDWISRHSKLTAASCGRLERVLSGGRVLVHPDRLVMVKDTDFEFWKRHREFWDRLTENELRRAEELIERLQQENERVGASATEALIANGSLALLLAEQMTKREAAEQRVVELEEELIEAISEAVQQECALPGRPGVFSHSFMATHEGWIEFLVKRGRMRLMAGSRTEYEFVDAPAGSDVWPTAGGGVVAGRESGLGAGRSVVELDRGEIARQVLWRVLRDDPPWPLERVECSIVPAVGVTWLIVREGDVGYMVLDTKALSGEALEYEFALATVLRVEFLDPDKEGVGWIELRRISDGQVLSYKLVVTGLGVVCE